MKKKFIVWKEKWNTGIGIIDKQHKHFVKTLNKTYALNKDGKEKINFYYILNDLTEYARVHFSTEEGYLERANYPGLESHIKSHMEILNKFLAFYTKFEEKDYSSEFGEELLNFLKDWLDNHLIKIDHEYVSWLNEPGMK